MHDYMFQVSVSSSSQSSRSNSSPHMTLEELRAINKYAESTKSLSYLPQVCTNAIFYRYNDLKLNKFIFEMYSISNIEMRELTAYKI